ncbi:MAG TPA: FliG C-terminal domain-containing protein [bacterium]|nr:FliG C-terminal domain-containing protein [bacterium]HQL63859.1 FliG C-terminal domain-containing protein [bacterium]
MDTKKKGPGGVEKLAGILGHVDRKTEQKVLETLQGRAPKVAGKIREKLVTFDDLAVMDDRTIQAAMRHIDRSLLAMALRGAPADLMQKILRNMSERAGEMLTDEIERLGPQPRSKVGEAQQEIMKVLRDLENAGRISLTRPDDRFVE